MIKSGRKRCRKWSLHFHDTWATFSPGNKKTKENDDQKNIGDRLLGHLPLHNSKRFTFDTIFGGLLVCRVIFGLILLLNLLSCHRERDHELMKSQWITEYYNVIECGKTSFLFILCAVNKRRRVGRFYFQQSL